MSPTSFLRTWWGKKLWLRSWFSSGFDSWTRILFGSWGYDWWVRVLFHRRSWWNFWSWAAKFLLAPLMFRLLSAVVSTDLRLMAKSCSKDCYSCRFIRWSSGTFRWALPHCTVSSVFRCSPWSTCATLFRFHRLGCRTLAVWLRVAGGGRWGSWTWLRDRTCGLVFRRCRSWFLHRWGLASGSLGWCIFFGCCGLMSKSVRDPWFRTRNKEFQW